MLKSYRLAVAALFLCAGALSAQTNSESSSAWIQLNLAVPGARSLGLGGAFLALADDATAVYANPAGISQLPGLEFSLEGREWQFTHRYEQGDRYPSPVAKREEEKTWSSGVSFASMVYGRNRWGAGIYFHRLAAFRANFDSVGPRITENRRLFPSRIRHSLDLESTGVSFGWRSEKAALGVGHIWYNPHVESVTERFRVGELDEVVDFEVTDNIHDFQVQKGGDDERGWTLGALWQITKTVRLGAALRTGVSMGSQAENLQGPAFRGNPDQLAPVPVGPRIRVPQVWGVGVMWSPTREVRWKLSDGTEARTRFPRRWKFALDVYEVGYDSIANGVVDVFNLPDEEKELGAFRSQDKIEVHGGAEMAIGPRGGAGFLRLGAWVDRKHALHFDGDDEGFRYVFRSEGTELIHVSVGLGTRPFSLSRGWELQLDAAVDRSSRIDTGSLSFVVRNVDVQ